MGVAPCYENIQVLDKIDRLAATLLPLSIAKFLCLLISTSGCKAKKMLGNDPTPATPGIILYFQRYEVG